MAKLSSKKYAINLIRTDSKTNFLALAVKLQFERSSKEPDIRNTCYRVFTNVYDVNCKSFLQTVH